RRREPSLDDVHAQLVELPREHELLARRHSVAGRLLAVPQGGVEDSNSIHDDLDQLARRRVTGSPEALACRGLTLLTRDVARRGQSGEKSRNSAGFIGSSRGARASEALRGARDRNAFAGAPLW